MNRYVQLHRLVLLFVLMLVSGLSQAAMANKPLVEPAPFDVPANASEESVAKSIRAALLGRGWAVSKEQPQYIEGTLTVRQHVLKVGISYGGGKVAIKYVDSAELNYEVKGGSRFIHPKFTNWTNNLVLDIKANLARA